MLMERVRSMVNQIAYTQLSFRGLASLSITQLSLIPLLSFTSSLYKLILSLRNHLYYFGLLPKHRLPVPVISIGNLTWGGNGKTPMVEYISRWLVDSGISPLILTRGYGTADEAKMLSRHFDGTSAKIGLGTDRAAVAACFFKKYGHMDLRSMTCIENLCSEQDGGSHLDSTKIGVAILDDGMQHLSLRRDMEIVMVNGMTPWGNYRLLPLGPLREPLTAIKRADIVVVHHADLILEQQIEFIESTIREIKRDVPIYYTRMIPSYFFNVVNVSSHLPLEAIQDRTVLCVSAIGSANPFVLSIKKVRPIYVDRLDFSDHHLFQNEDVEKIIVRLQKLLIKFGCKPIAIVTEKDYDRDPMFFRNLDPFEVMVLCSKLHVVPHQSCSDGNFKKSLKQLIEGFYLDRA